MSTSGLLTEKEQELVALGASVAAGCRPCTAHHVRAARVAGADKEEIRQAVNDALGVRRSASDIMERLAAKYLGDAPAEEASHGSEQSLMGELVSVGAALAVNCVISLEIHLKAAYQAGATVRQIQTALGIARAVKNMAAKKADETIAKMAGESQVCANDCGYQNDAAKATEGSEGCADDCGCQNESQPSLRSAACSCGDAERAAMACCQN
jgi:AhpD family alkylhydroperoxidase